MKKITDTLLLLLRCKQPFLSISAVLYLIVVKKRASVDVNIELYTDKCDSS